MQMPPTAKSVLIALADQADDRGHSFPSLTTIMARTCFGRTAVIEAIKWLEEHEVVKADRSNRYKTTYIVTPDSFTGVVREVNQSAKRTSTQGGALVRLADDEVRETDDEVRETDTNHQEPSVTTNKSNHQKPREQVALPDWLPTDAWDDWVKFRKSLRKSPFTDKAQALSLRTLTDLHAKGFDARQIIERSIERGWTGLFEPRQDQKQSNRPSVNDRFSGSTYEGSPDHEIPESLRAFA